MPNHVYSRLIVSGDPSDIKKFKKAAYGFYGNSNKELSDLSCDAFIPYPKYLRKMDEKREKWLTKYTDWGGEKTWGWEFNEEAKKLGFDYKDVPKDSYNSGGHGWCCDKWGTKWGFYEVDLYLISKNRLEYRFETAWSPALPVLKKMIKLFPELSFEYRFFDEGGNYWGLYRKIPGQKFFEESCEYEKDIFHDPEFCERFDEKTGKFDEDGECECFDNFMDSFLSDSGI